MRKFVLFILLTICSYPLLAQQQDRIVIYSDKAPKPIGPYSQGILTGNTLYLAGQIAKIPETGGMDTLNIVSEIRRVFSNLGAVLNAAGMGYTNLVKTTVYCTDINNFNAINAVYGEYFKDNFPARETIQVVALPGKAHVEISGIAVK